MILSRFLKPSVENNNLPCPQCIRIRHRVHPRVILHLFLLLPICVVKYTLLVPSPQTLPAQNSEGRMKCSLEVELLVKKKKNGMLMMFAPALATCYISSLLHLDSKASGVKMIISSLWCVGVSP